MSMENGTKELRKVYSIRLSESEYAALASFGGGRLTHGIKKILKVAIDARKLDPTNTDRALRFLKRSIEDYLFEVRLALDPRAKEPSLLKSMLRLHRRAFKEAAKAADRVENVDKSQPSTHDPDADRPVRELLSSDEIDRIRKRFLEGL